MKKFLTSVTLLGSLASLSPLLSAQTVVLQTSMGELQIKLEPEKAPKTVANFLQYVKDGHYENTIFHRVINGFMIQGGGMTADLQEKPTRAPIPLESSNGLSNKKGTVAMARTNAPHSASAQFFINIKNNDFLDYPGQDGWGYCVFGKVTEGTEVVDKIRAVKTTRSGMFSDVPAEDVIIEKAAIV